MSTTRRTRRRQLRLPALDAAETTIDLLTEWDTTRPRQPTVTAYRNPVVIDTARHAVRPNTNPTVSW